MNDTAAMNIKSKTRNYESNNEFVVEEQAVTFKDELRRSKLIRLSTISLNIIPIDQTTKHILLTNNGYVMAVSGDTGNLVCVSISIYILNIV